MELRRFNISNLRKWQTIFFLVAAIVINLSNRSTEANEGSIKIAYIGGLSGRNSEASQRSLNALRLVVEQFNKEGGVSGKPVEILAFDNESSPIKNLSIFRKAKLEGAIAITGVHISNDGILLADMAEKEKIPLVVASATNPEISTNRHFVVQVCFTDDYEGDLLAQFALKDLKARNIITVTDVSDNASSRVAKAFLQAVRSRGGNILKTYLIRTGYQDFSEIVSSIKSLAAVDLIFVSASSVESIFLLHQINRAAIHTSILGTDNWQNQDLAEGLHSLGDTVTTAIFPAHWHDRLAGSTSKKFLREYETRYRQRLSAFDADPALTYDAGKLLLVALRKAGSQDPSKIMSAIRSISLDGATGTIRFNSAGQPIKDVFFLRMVGRIVEPMDSLR